MDDAKKAFEELVTLHQKPLLRFVQSRIEDREAAKDIVSETFEVTWRKFATLTSPDMGWLVRVAEGKIRDHRKQRRRQARLESKIAVLDAAPPQPLSALDKLIVTSAVQELPPVQREILILSIRDDLSAAEIAARLGRSTGSVWTELSRARSTLRERLGEHPTGAREGETR